ncbi:hypothetical protein P3T76_015795 [Phytophthora citrophthora]|uniref:Uncharacterized protein n=1 Tax=Phytophthora citrophthora TaxID=4793 RepID=A0AAD9FZ75_9STRA|nr:hypothetical protein P3T76_015795 [Phytophthora citrophthora]
MEMHEQSSDQTVLCFNDVKRRITVNTSTDLIHECHALHAELYLRRGDTFASTTTYLFPKTT